ncbi:MAG: CBS domain-containing protein [Myxococcales bacterium]|nr:CBS domain-containing protein [Myxococcales bacterium]
MRPSEQTVAEIMEREVATLGADEHLDLVEDVMRLGRVRHMPVLDGDRVIGIVSQRDLLAASLSKALAFDPSERRTFLRSIVVREVMSRDVETIEPDATLREAAQRMMQRNIGCLPVVRDGHFEGLVTETDLLRAALLASGEEQSEVIDVDAEPAEGGRGERELVDLRRLRDELRLQIHLGKAEARELWADLEQRWGEMEAKIREGAQRAEKPLDELGETARRIADEIRTGYRRIRKLL